MPHVLQKLPFDKLKNKIIICRKGKTNMLSGLFSMSGLLILKIVYGKDKEAIKRIGVGRRILLSICFVFWIIELITLLGGTTTPDTVLVAVGFPAFVLVWTIVARNRMHKQTSVDQDSATKTTYEAQPHNETNAVPNPKYCSRHISYIDNGNDNNDSVEFSATAMLLDTDPTENYSTSCDREPSFHIERGNVYLSVKKWVLAQKEFESALTINPQIAEAYIGLCLSDHHFSKVSELESCTKDLRLDANFMFALKYATGEHRQMLQHLMERANNNKIQRLNKRRRQWRHVLIAIISLVCLIIVGVGAFGAYIQLSYFPSMYDMGIDQLEEGNFEQAASYFGKASGYKDSDDYYFYSKGMSYTIENNLEGYYYLKLCENLPESKNTLSSHPAYILLSKIQGDWIKLSNDGYSDWVLIEYSISIENDTIANNSGGQEYFGRGHIIYQGDALWFLNESVRGDKKAEIIILDYNHIEISGIILEREA